MKLADLDGDGKQALFFTFSWGSGIHRSQIGYFDPSTKQVQILNFSNTNGDMILVDNHSGGLSVYQATLSNMDDFVNFEIEATDYLSDLVFVDGLVKLDRVSNE